MVRVLRTDVKKGTSRELNVTTKCWERIKAQPSIFGAFLKWEHIVDKGQFDPGAKHKVHDDMAEPQKSSYNEDSYLYDCEKGKQHFKSGEYSQALPYLERAIKFQPRNQYVRKLIKQIKDGKGATD
jgi:hypothetical protein